jgi:O-antigen/teichoic acid export membrane protein
VGQRAHCFCVGACDKRIAEVTPSLTTNALEAACEKGKAPGFWSSIAVLSSGAIGVQVISALCSPLLTRLYSPADIGVMGIFNSILMILLLLGTLQYEMAVALPAKQEEARDIAAVAFLCLLAISLISVPALLICKGPLFARLNAEALLSYWWLIPVGLFASGTYQVLNVWSLRVKRHREIAKTNVNQTVMQLVIQLGCGFIGAGFVGLLSGAVAGRFTGIFRLAKSAIANDKIWTPRPSAQSMTATMRSYVEFPLYSCPGALLRLGVIQFTPLFLAGRYSLLQAGFFALQERLIMVPLTTLGSSVASVFYVEAAELYLTNPARLHALFRATVKRLLIIGSAPTGILLVFGAELFGVVFGERWREAGRYAQILALPGLARFVCGPVFRCLTIIGHQKVQLLCDFIGLVLLGGGFYYCDISELGPVTAVMVFGVSTSATYILAHVCAEVYLRRIALKGAAH